MNETSKHILVTGANRGLGLKVAQNLAQTGAQLFITARDKEALESHYQSEGIPFSKAFSLHLEAANEANITAMLEEIPQLSAVVHCASPYMMDAFLDTPCTTMRDYTQCMLSDQILCSKSIRAMLQHTNSGVFIFTGAVIGLPHVHSRGEMGLLKTHQRQLAATCEHELRARKTSVYVRHLNLGTFQDTVEDPHQAIPTSRVVDTLASIIENPADAPHTLHLVSPQNEIDYDVQASAALRQSS
ncbi:MAG: hypothetical protein Tsb0018_10040 [Opitutales bacterium]